MNIETKLKIGELELGQGLILAPMAGITDLSFRRITKSFDVDLVTSEMVSSEGLVRNTARTKMLLQSHAEEKPLAIQLFGSDPKVVAEAARIVADEGADIIDLNMGCPVPKVVRQGAGAALLRDAETVAMLVDAVRQAVSIPGYGENSIRLESIQDQRPGGGQSCRGCGCGCHNHSSAYSKARIFWICGLASHCQGQTSCEYSGDWQW